MKKFMNKLFGGRNKERSWEEYLRVEFKKDYEVLRQSGLLTSQRYNYNTLHNFYG